MSQINGVGGRPAILVEGLTKSFGEVRALRGIDLAVPRGTVLGVLGPNGAGKTTAVRILTTLLLPDGGRALVEGYDVVRQAAAVRRSIGLAGQSAAIQEELTGRENLEIVGRLYHLSWPQARSRATEPLADSETGMVSIKVGSRGSDALVETVRALDAAGLETRGLAMRRPSLDDVFLALTGHAAEEEEPGGRRRGRRGGKRGKDMERTAS